MRQLVARIRAWWRMDNRCMCAVLMTPRHEHPSWDAGPCRVENCICRGALC